MTSAGGGGGQDARVRAQGHRSTRELEQAIRSYLNVNNSAPKPFSWSKTVDDILASIERFGLRIYKSAH
jgi:hypothetical protein